MRVNDALIGMIVLIGKQNRPIRIERCRIDGKSMVLSGYEAAAGVRMSARLIQPSIAISYHTNINDGYHTSPVLPLCYIYQQIIHSYIKHY